MYYPYLYLLLKLKPTFKLHIREKNNNFKVRVCTIVYNMEIILDEQQQTILKQVRILLPTHGQFLSREREGKNIFKHFQTLYL